jgi:hypothetical protein
VTVEEKQLLLEDWLIKHNVVRDDAQAKLGAQALAAGVALEDVLPAKTISDQLTTASGADVSLTLGTLSQVISLENVRRENRQVQTRIDAKTTTRTSYRYAAEQAIANQRVAQDDFDKTIPELRGNLLSDIGAAAGGDADKAKELMSQKLETTNLPHTNIDTVLRIVKGLKIESGLKPGVDDLTNPDVFKKQMTVGDLTQLINHIDAANPAKPPKTSKKKEEEI